MKHRIALRWDRPVTLGMALAVALAIALPLAVATGLLTALAAPALAAPTTLSYQG